MVQDGRVVSTQPLEDLRIFVVTIPSSMKSGLIVITCAVMFLALIGCTRGDSGGVDGSSGNPTGEAHTRIKPGPITYVALGDSTGVGVGAHGGGYVSRLVNRLKPLRPNSKLVNLCFSGATTEDVVRSQLNEGVSEVPDLITLGIGINDIGHGISLSQFAKNYEEILNTLKSKTAAVIVVTNIPDISTAPRIPVAVRNEYQQRIVRFNETLETIASAHGVLLVDIHSLTREKLPSHPEFFSADGFHPSDQGYELWADQMWPTIAEVLE